MPLSLSAFPKAILHVDGDCFFAACEVAKRPELRGRPVITGLERGIASSFSYEAKARGVSRGMSLRDIKRICPEAVFLPSDYETYSLYSLRMFSIVRRFTPDVEEYSIDECFADLTGLQRPLGLSYEKMAVAIKQALDSELGFTFSVGLAPTKVLAKVGSKWLKPSGLTVIPGNRIDDYLDKLSLDKVWGIGPQTSAYLKKYGLYTARQFAGQDPDWIRTRLAKPHQEIWQELRGQAVYMVNPAKKTGYQSLSKTKTFAPPSSDRERVFSHLSKNTENACIKLRRYGLAARKVFFFLKTQDFRYQGLEFQLFRPTDNPIEIIKMIDKNFNQVFSAAQLFRATGIILSDLKENKLRQADLFNETIQAEKISRIFSGADGLAKKYGQHSLFLGSSLSALKKNSPLHPKQQETDRKTELFAGESYRKRLALPFLGKTV